MQLRLDIHGRHHFFSKQLCSTSAPGHGHARLLDRVLAKIEVEKPKIEVTGFEILISLAKEEGKILYLIS